MNNLCAECGFEKECSEEEFMSHMYLHDEMDAICDELGIAQEQTWNVRVENGEIILEIASW